MHLLTILELCYNFIMILSTCQRLIIFKVLRTYAQGIRSDFL